LPEVVQEGFALGPPTQPPERLQQREIRFPRPILMNALPMPDPILLPVSYARHESVNQSGLANPGLAGDEPYSALAP
jgi:hypothetical protein